MVHDGEELLSDTFMITAPFFVLLRLPGKLPTYPRRISAPAESEALPAVEGADEMAADESIDWEFGKAPKQSITELLHNPRGPTLELPDVSTFDLSAASLSLTPLPQTNLPRPLNINHFEAYLRRYGPLHEAYLREKNRPAPFLQPLDAVPPLYFDDSFSLSSNDQLAPIQSTDGPLSENPRLPQLNSEIASYRATLEHHLKLRLDEQASEISLAITNIRTLRETVLDTARSIRETSEQATHLIPIITTPIAAIRKLTFIQSNLRALKNAAQRIQLVSTTPGDVAVLLDTGEYAAAIDAVASAKEALTHKDLSSIRPLAPLRARLAQCVESIDKALRREFRDALADSNEPTLKEVVSLVARMGRLSLLHRFFMREIKDNLARELKDVVVLHSAIQAVSACAERAVMLVRIIQEGDVTDGERARVSKENMRDEYLRDAHADLEEMLCAVVDRVLGSLSVAADARSGFVVITRDDRVTPETCFDEFKAALRFGEEIRSLEMTASKLEEMFSVNRRGSKLRAKVSERQIAFLGAFHKAHVDKLTQTIRSDKWQEVRVPEGALRLLASVIETSSGSARPLVNGVMKPQEGKVSDNVQGVIVIGSTAFKTVTSGVRYMRSMCAYTLLAEKSPNLASEIARRGSEFSRLFNSLVGKAVLGAAALEWSGLRSITARHLSLASRTIAMAASLAERINKPLEDALSGAQVDIIRPLVQKSERDLRDHHGQLLAKILAIMMDRLEAHETVLRSLPWDKAQEMQRFDIPSAYIVTLAKEATVLHKILWSILPTTEVFDIFQRVCAAYGDHLTDAYGRLDGGKKWIRRRVAGDVSCLHDKLLMLEVFKANPSSFKPLSKLYSRFAKEVIEEEAEMSKRSFNRQADKSSALSSKDAVSKEQVPVNSTPKVTPSPSENGRPQAVAQENGSAQEEMSSDKSGVDSPSNVTGPMEVNLKENDDEKVPEDGDHLNRSAAVVCADHRVHLAVEAAVVDLVDKAAGKRVEGPGVAEVNAIEASSPVVSDFSPGDAQTADVVQEVSSSHERNNIHSMNSEPVSGREEIPKVDVVELKDKSSETAE